MLMPTDFVHGRRVVPEGARGAMAPPDIGRSDNPMSTGGKGADYAHLITTGTSGFSDLPTALSVVRSGIYMIYHIKK